MIFYRRLSWWYWLASAALLAIGLAGATVGFAAVAVLGVIQTLHFVRLERSLTSFPVQVRTAYVLLLVIAPRVPFHALYWSLFVGTTVMVLSGYCFLARALSLLPWNRPEPFSADLVKRTFLAPPSAGNLLQGLPTT
jgi:hypothetical protein